MTEAIVENMFVSLPNFIGLVVLSAVLWRINNRLIDSLLEQQKRADELIKAELDDAREIVRQRMHNLEALTSDAITRPVLTDEVNRERIRREWEKINGPLPRSD